MTTIHVGKNGSLNNEKALKNWNALRSNLGGKYQPIPVTIAQEGNLYHGEAQPRYPDDSRRIDVTGIKTENGSLKGIAIQYDPLLHRNRDIELVTSFNTDNLVLGNFAVITLNLSFPEPGRERDLLIPRYPGNIAFITDFGDQDTYVGEVKGAIRQKNLHAVIDDITHKVPRFDIRSGSYLLAKAAKAFPERTVFVGVVDPGVGTSREAIAVETQNGNRYIVPNNGLLTHVLQTNQVRAAHRIENRFFLGDSFSERDKTFHGRDVFGPAAAVLALGFPLGWIGPVIERFIPLDITPPARDGNGAVTGEIEHVDHYGNVVTNIGQDVLKGFKFGDRLRIEVGGRTFDLDFVETYGNTPKGALVGVITSDHTFEVARNQASANETLTVNAGNFISIRRIER